MAGDGRRQQDFAIGVVGVRLVEDDVEADDRHLGLGQLVQQGGVHRSSPWPAADARQAGLVDGDDDDVGRCRPGQQW